MSINENNTKEADAKKLETKYYFAKN